MAGLVGCYALACVWALWNRTDAVFAFGGASLVTIGYISPRIVQRVLLGFVLDAIAAALLFLPAIGDVIDAVGGLVAIVVFVGKWARFLRNLPCGIAWCGLFATLWYETRILPPSFSVTASSHSFWFYLMIVVASAVGGALVIVLLTGLARLVTRHEHSRAMFYSIGYPWYLLMFLIAFFVPDPDFDYGS